MYLVANYPMSRYHSQDREIRAALIEALRPFGIDAEDGSGTDYDTRDVSFTLPEEADAEGALLAASSVMFGYDGKARLFPTNEYVEVNAPGTSPIPSAFTTP